MKTDDKLFIALGVLVMFLGLITRETAETWVKLLYMINLGLLLRAVYRAGKAAAMKEIEIASKAIDYAKGGDAQQ